MRPRKAEREALTELLDQEWDSVDALALAVFDLVATQVLARDWWMLVAAQPDYLACFGPYGTRNRTVSAVGELELKSPSVRVFIRKVCNMADMEVEADA